MTYHALGVIADAGGRITYGQLHKRLVPALREAPVRPGAAARGSRRVQAPPDLHLMTRRRAGVVILGAYSHAGRRWRPTAAEDRPGVDRPARRPPLPRRHPRGGHGPGVPPGGRRAAGDGGAAAGARRRPPPLVDRPRADRGPGPRRRPSSSAARCTARSSAAGAVRCWPRCSRRRCCSTSTSRCSACRGRRCGRPTGELALDVPFGRIVTTTTTPAARRDPTTDDPTVKILAVVNPTDDLAATAAELAVLRDLAGRAGRRPGRARRPRGRGGDAARACAAAVRGRDHDIVHFAGHARFDAGDPHDSSLLLADGELTADHVGDGWRGRRRRTSCSTAPASRPGSPRAGRWSPPVAGPTGCRRRSWPPAARPTSGTSGPSATWPPPSSPAASTRRCSATSTPARAVLDARRAVRGRYDESADLAAFGAVFFGDAGYDEGRPTRPGPGGLTWPVAPIVLTGTVVTFDDAQPVVTGGAVYIGADGTDRRRPAEPARGRPPGSPAPDGWRPAA